jgi:HPt (histidine-containing phosphotransfer) domain-containing protein
LKQAAWQTPHHGRFAGGKMRQVQKTSINRARIEQLAGGPEGAAEVLAELELGVRADIVAVRSALESANTAALRRAAHRIKGSALTIGAEGLATLAARVLDAPADVEAPRLMGNASALLAELEHVLASALRP